MAGKSHYEFEELSRRLWSERGCEAGEPKLANLIRSQEARAFVGMLKEFGEKVTALPLRDLASRYARDSSIPTSGGLFPVPNNGCASARPFMIEGIAEIPLSMPRDGSLRFLGYAPDDIARIWIECADLIARSGGTVVLLTHCERRFSGNDRMFTAYRRFLDHLAGHPERFTFTQMMCV